MKLRGCIYLILKYLCTYFSGHRDICNPAEIYRQNRHLFKSLDYYKVGAGKQLTLLALRAWSAASQNRRAEGSTVECGQRALASALIHSSTVTRTLQSGFCKYVPTIADT